jgi:hypothetical protein
LSWNFLAVDWSGVLTASNSIFDMAGKGTAKDEEYQVEEIVKMRTIKGKREFFVKWKGYSTSENTWYFKLN